MRYLAWVLRLLLFLIVFGFALQNAEVVTLHYYFGYEWRAPLTLILLFFFGGGAGVGIIACLATIFRQRREIALLKSRSQPPN